MALAVDHQRAGELLLTAHRLAMSDEALPEHWIRSVEEVGSTPGWRTPVAVVGTVLLAKSVDARVNAFSLKATAEIESPYSPRGLCHEVLVPFAWEHGYDLGATGREPLNNQPWFRYDYVSDEMRVRDRPALHRLIGVLHDANGLNEDEALAALAAFLRVRRRRLRSVDEASTAGAADLGSMISTAEPYVLATTDGGRRGQAFAAAALDLVFDEVQMLRVNDPSRHWPGDVYVADPEDPDAPPVLGVEVKQKPIPAGEVLHFASELRRFGVERGLMAAIGPRQDPLDEDALSRRAAAEFGVALQVVTSPHDLLTRAVGWASEPTALVLARFPSLMLARLLEIEVPDESLAEWRARWE